MSATADREEIARRAYAIWEERGRPEGQSDECWLEAERELVSSGEPRHERSRAEAERFRGADRSSSETGISNLDRALAPSERRRVRADRNAVENPPDDVEDASFAEPEHFLVVLDRAHLRIYRAEAPIVGSSPRLELVEALDVPAGKQRYTATESDQAGRFPGSKGPTPGGGAPAGQSIDERLPMQEEHQRRIVGELASHLGQFLQLHPRATWDYAAPDALHPAVLERLEPSVRTRLGHALQKDLVNQPVEELRAHFPGPGSGEPRPAPATRIDIAATPKRRSTARKR